MRKIKLLLLLTLLVVGVSGTWAASTFYTVYCTPDVGGGVTITNPNLTRGTLSDTGYYWSSGTYAGCSILSAYYNSYYNNPTQLTTQNVSNYLTPVSVIGYTANITVANNPYTSTTLNGEQGYVYLITVTYSKATNPTTDSYLIGCTPTDLGATFSIKNANMPNNTTLARTSWYLGQGTYKGYSIVTATRNSTQNPSQLTSDNASSYIEGKAIEDYDISYEVTDDYLDANTGDGIYHARIVNIKYTPSVTSRSYTVSSNLSQGGIDGFVGTWPHDEEASLSGNTLTISTPSGSSYAPVALDNWNVNEYIIPKAVSGYKVTITVEGSTIKLNYYKTWVKDGLEYSNFHIQSSSNQGMMDEKFDFIPDQPELAVRLYLDQTKTVTDTVKYENPLWENPTVGDYREDLADDDGDGVGETATFTYLGQLDNNAERPMNQDYFYTRRHQIAYSERTSVTIPREVTFDGTTYKVTAIQKWGMDYTQTHIWLSDYCYNMNENGGSGQDTNTKVTEHQNINDHRNEYLTTVNFEMSADAPSNVASIGDYAFMSLYNTQNKTGMTDIIIPNSVTYLGAGLFECCLKLTNVTFQRETKVKNIRDYAFWCCVDLKEVTLPDGIETIGDCSFQYNFQMTKIELPNTLTTIGDHFLCCNSSLTTLTIPYSVTDIAGACFHGCERLTDVYLMGPASALKKESGSGGTFDANPRFCKDHVQDCTFHVFKEYYDSYVNDDVWREVDENGLYSGTYHGNTCLNGNKIEIVPDEKRTFEADKWVTVIFPHDVENYKTVFPANGTKETRVAKLTGATVTEGQDRDPKTGKLLRMYNLQFELIPGDDIPKETPVMICPATTVTDYIMYTADESANSESFKDEMTKKHPVVIDCGEYGTVTMKGQYSPYDLKTWDFFFAYQPGDLNEDGSAKNPAKFYRVPANSNYKVDRCRCWWTIDVNGIPNPGTMGAKDSSFFVDDETDNINGIDYRVTVGGIYDLNGRKLDVAPEDLPKGIFIVNGKKHVVK